MNKETLQVFFGFLVFIGLLVVAAVRASGEWRRDGYHHKGRLGKAVWLWAYHYSFGVTLVVSFIGFAVLAYVGIITTEVISRLMNR